MTNEGLVVRATLDHARQVLEEEASPVLTYQISQADIAHWRNRVPWTSDHQDLDVMGVLRASMHRAS